MPDEPLVSRKTRRKKRKPQSFVDAKKKAGYTPCRCGCGKYFRLTPHTPQVQWHRIYDHRTDLEKSIRGLDVRDIRIYSERSSKSIKRATRREHLFRQTLIFTGPTLRRIPLAKEISVEAGKAFANEEWENLKLVLHNKLMSKDAREQMWATDRIIQMGIGKFGTATPPEDEDKKTVLVSGKLPDVGDVE